MNMTTHYEGADATNIGVDWSSPHDKVGEDEIPPGHYALCVSSDSVFVIQGLPADILAVAQSILTAANEIAEHAARPLTLNDFSTDEDGFYQCPRCETSWEPGAAELTTLFYLVQSIEEHINSHRPAHERE